MPTCNFTTTAHINEQNRARFSEYIAYRESEAARLANLYPIEESDAMSDAELERLETAYPGAFDDSDPMTPCEFESCLHNACMESWGVVDSSYGPGYPFIELTDDNVDEFIRAERDAELVEGFSEYTEPIEVKGDMEDLPAILTREDGGAIVHAGKFSSFYGEPGSGKSWIGLIAAVEAAKLGGRVIWWDFEDSADTLARRSTLLGALPVMQQENVKFVKPELHDEHLSIQSARDWLAAGNEFCLLVIDSASASGCPSDGGDISQWFSTVIYPFESRDIAVVVIDHVPKQRKDRPRGAIGSTHKLSKLTGSGNYVEGVPWTADQCGQIYITMEKGRTGNHPVRNGEALAVLIGDYKDVGNGQKAFGYRFAMPDEKPQEDEGAAMNHLLLAIEANGGTVGSSRQLRQLVGKSGTLVDKLADKLVVARLLDTYKDGASNVFELSENGWEYVDRLNGIRNE